MKKIVLILGVLVLLVGGFFVYRYFAPREQADPLTIVPHNAALIIESSNIYQVWDHLKTKRVWANVKAVPSIASLTEKIASLDSLLVQDSKKDFFEDKKVVASLHISPGKNSDYVFYIPVNSSKEESFLKDAMNNLKQKTSYRMEERNFEDYTISTITSKGSKVSFSYFIYKNLLIGSYSSVLLEDLIRSLYKKKTYFFWKNEEAVKKHSQGVTTVYVNYTQLPSLFSLFSDSDVFKPISSFADESLLEFNINDKELLLNGITYASSSKPSFINSFKGQKPQQFYLKNYIPNSTTALYYYGFDDGKKLRKALEDFWKQEDPQYLRDIDVLNKKYGIDLGSLYEDFGNEIGLSISKIDTNSSQKMVFIHSKDSERLFLQLSKIVTLVAEKKKQALHNEKWQGIKINQMNLEEFPSAFLGKIFEGFPQCYFAAVDNYVVLANSKESIKDLVKDIEAENVWGKTLAINSSLEETITEFNVGLFVNVQTSWEAILDYSSPELKEEWLKNKRLLQGFDFLALQFSFLNETVLTNMVLTHNLSDPIVNAEEEEENSELVLENKIKGPFYLVDSKNPGRDMLFQDSSNILHRVGPDLKLKWSYQLNVPIASGIFTADIDKDRKWEYVFAAENKIYALDAKGKLLKRFPFKLADTVSLTNISVIDYSNTKEYRIVVSDRNGHVYFFDLKGKNLDGWEPRKLTGKLAERVKHFRVGNKDLIVCIQENGMVNVMNRRGEMYEGFPLDLKMKNIESFVIKTGKDFENTLGVVQNENGDIITFTMEGKLLKKESKFGRLCRDSKGNSYVIALMEGNDLSIMNKNSGGTLKFPFEENNVSINYGNLSTKGEFYTIKNLANKKLYIYNQKGKAMLKEPVNSDYHSDIYYNERKKSFEFFNSYQNKLEVIEF